MATNPRAVAEALIKAHQSAQQRRGILTLPGSQPATAYSDWIAGRSPATDVALPRPWETFQSGAFGPGMPIRPYPIDQPAEGEERPEPRRYQYPVAWNLPQSPPGTEGVKLATFGHLRAIAEIYSVARACIDVRIQEILGLDWDIVPTKAAEKKMRGSDTARKEFEDRRAPILKFWQRPDPNFFSFGAFLNSCLEDLFVIDAMTIWLAPTRGKGKGVGGSDLHHIRQIDGSTFRPLIDIHGGVPQPPNAAYSQYLHGVPRSDRMTMLTGADIKEMGEAKVADYRGDQLLYLPYTPRIFTPYGFAAVERALIPIMSGLQRQQYQREYFDSGTVPAVFLGTGDPNTSPQQCRELQDAINAQASDPGFKHQVLVVPGDAKAVPMRPNPLADMFDELVMSQVCMAFHVQPMELGISPRTSTSQSGGAANQMAKSSTDINERKALKPLLQWLAVVFDRITQDVIGATDMQWHWEGLGDDDDQQASVETLAAKVKIGGMSIDEMRIAQGDQPWGIDITSKPVYFTATGVVPLEEASPAQQKAAELEATAAHQPAPVGPSVEELLQPKAPGEPPGPLGGKRDRKARKAVRKATRLARKAGWRHASSSSTPGHAAGTAEADAQARIGGGAHTGRATGDRTAAGQKAARADLVKTDWKPDRYYHNWVPRELFDELEAVGADLHEDGTITVYHYTTSDAAARIRATGEMVGDEDGLFFTTRQGGQAAGYGSTAVRLRIPLRNLQIDDVFSDEAHLRLPVKRAGTRVPVADYLEDEDAGGAVVKLAAAPPVPWSPPPGVDTPAALRELDLIRRRLAKGQSLDGWERRHIPVEVFTQMQADLLKVGPKGYIHWWIYVGPHPAVGGLIRHPDHGDGRITSVGKTRIAGEFKEGTYSFDFRKETPDPAHFHERKTAAKKATPAVAKPAKVPAKKAVPKEKPAGSPAKATPRKRTPAKKTASPTPAAVLDLSGEPVVGPGKYSAMMDSVRGGSDIHEVTLGGQRIGSLVASRGGTVYANPDGDWKLPDPGPFRSTEEGAQALAVGYRRSRTQSPTERATEHVQDLLSHYLDQIDPEKDRHAHRMAETMQWSVEEALMRQTELAPFTVMSLHGVRYAKLGYGTQAQYNHFGNELLLSRAWIDTGGIRLMQASLAAHQSGWSTPTPDPRMPSGSIAHEFGHHVVKTISFGEWSPAQARAFFPALEESLGLPAGAIHSGRRFDKEAINRRLAEYSAAIRKAISGYAAQASADMGLEGTSSQFDEMLAEIWQEFSMMGKKARPHIKTLGQILARLAEESAERARR